MVSNELLMACVLSPPLNYNHVSESRTLQKVYVAVVSYALDLEEDFCHLPRSAMEDLYAYQRDGRPMPLLGVQPSWFRASEEEELATININTRPVLYS